MAGEEDGDAAAGLLAEQVDHRVDRGRVQAGERLVEDQRLRGVEQGRDDLHPLLVAEAELLDPVTGPLGQPEPVERRARRTPGLAGRQARELAEVDELVEDLLLGVEPALLRHVAEAAAVGGGDRALVPQHLTPVEPEQPHHHPHRGGLAGAVAADEARQLTGRDVERDVVHHRALAEATCQSPYLDHAPHAGAPRHHSAPPDDGHSLSLKVEAGGIARTPSEVEVRALGG